MDNLVSFLILEEMFQFFTIENDVGCGFFLYGLYYVEVSSLYAYFLDERNEIELFAMRWMDLESIIQSEVTQKIEKQIPYANTHSVNLKKWYR